jgi:[CysO sulfur-carrier protein]-S-L-cysteine hydrolase
MLALKKELFEQILKHCIKEFPNEACGILAGKGESARKAYEMANNDKSSQSFFMEPKEQLKVMKTIRELGLEMIAIYHSHVASQAYPSAHDVELAFYPEASYAIVSLEDRDNPSIRSFRIVEGKITEEELSIE